MGKLGCDFVVEFLLFIVKVRLMEAQMTRQITSKGQVTIPRVLREELGLVPGDRVDFVKSKEGDILVKKSLSRENFFGLLDAHSDERSVSLDGIDEAISRAVGNDFGK